MPASTSASASISRVRHASARSPSRPLQLPERLAALRLGVGADQIGETLDRGQIELAVLEGAARELARLGRPEARRAGRAPPAPRRSPPGRHGPAARPCPRRSRCSAPGTRAPAPRRSPRRSPDRARARAPPGAAPARGRSALRARRRACGPETRTPRSPPAAGRTRGRRWCRDRRGHRYASP